jgi:hypothetical protein
MCEQDPHGRYFLEEGLCPQSKNIYLQGKKRRAAAGLMEDRGQLNEKNRDPMPKIAAPISDAALKPKDRFFPSLPPSLQTIIIRHKRRQGGCSGA